VFNGKITGFYSNIDEDKLVFVVATREMPYFKIIAEIPEKYKSIRQLRHRPQVGEYCLFLHPEKQVLHRAIRLKCTPTLDATRTCRLLLVDTGEVIWEIFDKKKFNIFELPKHINDQIPFFNQMCRINKFPDLGQHRTLGDFYEAVKDNYLLKFTVTKFEDFECESFGWKQEVLTVDIEFARENDFTELCEALNKVRLTAENLLKLEREMEPPMVLTYFSNPHSPMITDVNKFKYELPSKGDYVVVYPSAFLKPNYIFAQIRLIDRDWSDETPLDVKTAQELKYSMNDDRLKWKKLSAPPVKDQLVVASRVEVILKILNLNSQSLNFNSNFTD
jgi:hypothetical protein